MERTKPDLMIANGSRRPANSTRILAQLEHGVRPPAHPARAAGWTIDGWTIGLFALLLLMCSVAWLMHDKTITPKAFRHDYGSSASYSPARRTVESTPALEQAATIVNEEAALSANTRSERTAAAMEPAGTPRAERTVATTPRPAASAPRASAATTQSARTAAATTPAASPAGAAPGSDTDVTLLSALMAHAGKPAVVTPERPRDVVERQDGDSTALLLARCKQLGLIEGMLCRSRICSGRWEADAACRAPSH